MKLKSINLQNFRKFDHYQLDLDDQVTVLVGENASGKTSIIEAIFLLGTGDSFRAGKIDEMISFGQEIGRVSAVLIDQEEENQQIEILLTRGIVQGKRTAKRLYSVNQVKKRKKDTVGKILSVVFRPEDMRLVEGSPGRRRDFIDTALSLKVKNYATSLNTYNQALVKRNKLLFQVREGEMPRAVLSFWTSQLIKHGTFLQQARQKFFSRFDSVDFPIDFQVEYLPSIISQERIDKYIDREIASGHTLVGPHKDDFIVNLYDPNNVIPEPDRESNTINKGFDVAIYGSRGQQRMAVLWLKFCELVLLEEDMEQKAVLLLDDILSELDEQSREKVLSLVDDHQTIVSTADEDTLKELEEQLSQIQVVRMED